MESVDRGVFSSSLAVDGESVVRDIGFVNGRVLFSCGEKALAGDVRGWRRYPSRFGRGAENVRLKPG